MSPKSYRLGPWSQTNPGCKPASQLCDLRRASAHLVPELPHRLNGEKTSIIYIRSENLLNEIKHLAQCLGHHQCLKMAKGKRSLKNPYFRGAWVAQSVERPTWAQVVISLFAGLSPASGSVLTARSPEPASDSVSLSRSPPSLLMLCLSLCHSLQIKKKIKLRKLKKNCGMCKAETCVFTVTLTTS